VKGGAFWRQRAVMIVLLAVSSAVSADHVVGHASIGRIDIYLGVLPAEMLRGHPRAHPESMMHGGAPESAFHHVSVALFDRTTGRRILGARVEAQVSGENYSGPRKVLEPMQAEGARLYGNYFAFGGAAAHNVRVWVMLPDSREPVVEDFDWARS